MEHTVDSAEGACGIVALLTDFGARDHYVGAVKAAVLSVFPSAKIVDISHEIRPQDIRSAGFSLWASYRDFPKGTVFVCVVDPGVGSGRRRLILRSRDYQFVAPDNGVLSWVMYDGDSFEAFEIVNANCFGPRVSGTFDGRDVFGPVGAHLASGAPAERIGIAIDSVVSVETGLDVAEDGAVRSTTVVHIDHFGNIITGLPATLLAEGAVLNIAGAKISEIRTSFNEGDAGAPFLIAGSSGLVEVACYGDSAAEALSVSVGDSVGLILPERPLTQ